jgi:hypothetical protein
MRKTEFLRRQHDAFPVICVACQGTGWRFFGIDVAHSGRRGVISYQSCHICKGSGRSDRPGSLKAAKVLNINILGLDESGRVRFGKGAKSVGLGSASATTKDRAPRS